LSTLLKMAQVPRTSRLIQRARNTVKQAQETWPSLLEDAPSSMRKTVLERLQGGVALTQG